MLDYYKILGINYTEDQKVIHEAYRRMALKYHPDINHDAGADEKFKLINKAYDVLSNEKLKLNYDMKYLKGLRTKKKFVRKYSGESEKIYSDDQTDKFNSYVYKNSKEEFSS